MFTGITQALGRVQSLNGGILQLEPAEFAEEPLALGESIAVNGVCLTVAEFDNGLRFDLSPETLQRTSLGSLKPGSRVNLERAMAAIGRFGGHFVQGHVDATAEVIGVAPEGNSTVFTFRVPREYGTYVIDKGSVCLDGISLTAVQPRDGAEGTEFDVWVIPHTLRETNLGERNPGDRVNLEVDVLARYVARLLESRTA